MSIENTFQSFVNASLVDNLRLDIHRAIFIPILSDRLLLALSLSRGRLLLLSRRRVSVLVPVD